MDTYRTTAAPTQGEYKDKGSRFVACAYPISEADAHPAAVQDAVRKQVDALRAEHHKARHFCYAWRTGLDKNAYRANDDGEPSGTAGKPILGQIDSAGLTNVLVIVVRYFGGTKLGTSGLIQAYKQAALDALAQATIVTRRVECVFAARCDYAAVSAVLQAVKKAESRVVTQIFDAEVRLDIAAPLDEVAALQTALADIDNCTVIDE